MGEVPPNLTKVHVDPGASGFLHGLDVPEAGRASRTTVQHHLLALSLEGCHTGSREE